MAKLEDHLRSFGMSALLISDEISQIEAAYSVNLQDRGKSSAEDPRGYYGQFDNLIRLQASEMAAHYEPIDMRRTRDRVRAGRRAMPPAAR